MNRNECLRKHAPIKNNYAQSYDEMMFRKPLMIFLNTVSNQQLFQGGKCDAESRIHSTEMQILGILFLLRIMHSFSNHVFSFTFK